ncbi:hypothetical protein BZL29_5182 [Mycobacterium kansasii]|uniref:Uncharacterized protein n=1 Tax=Mycobacterium kansasii TaxID=1768 RepID=A0A1V3X0X5_MYCKA|nr:hypothetical protein BZL29_5182 [Mycobacterium kansasii]
MDGGSRGTGLQRHRQDRLERRRGVKGFFEKTFAPLGLKRIQGEVLANLKKQLEG